jgi:hypothetical protein
MIEERTVSEFSAGRAGRGLGAILWVLGLAACAPAALLTMTKREM